MTNNSELKNAGPTGNPALSIDEARQAILNLVSVTSETETVALIDAVDRVSAEDIQARHAIPLFRNSAMDGFAIRHDDFTPAATFNIVGKSLAGHPFEGRLSTGDAIEITTGAMIPDDADTIVIVENTTVDGQQLTVNQVPVRQQHVRVPGDDIVANTTIVSSLQRLTPSDCGLLAAQGIDSVSVTRKPRVGILSTGDELRSHGESLTNGQIYDSNRVTITSLLRRCGLEAEDLGIVQDDPESLQQLLDSRDDLDFILSSGGVSVGQADYVKAVVEQNGELVFWKIAMKPGKPMVTARLNTGALYFGLPGNPVSSLVTCVQFVIPALQAFSGETYQPALTVEAICTSALTKEKGRFEFQRGTLSSNNEQLTVTTTGLQDSHVLSSVSQANCFICLPQFSTGAAAGEKVQVIPFHALPGL
jgi:molybdopterin molybdotransferase